MSVVLVGTKGMGLNDCSAKGIDMFKLVVNIIVVMVVSLVSLDASAKSTRRIYFNRAADVVVDGLYIEFAQTVTPVIDELSAGISFESRKGDHVIVYTLDSSADAAGIYVDVESANAHIDVQRWWWLSGGQKVNEVRGSGPTASVRFDQDFIPAGGTATVSARVTAEQGTNALLTVTYEVLNASNSVVVPATSLIAVVPAGQEYVHQPTVLQLNKTGTYTVNYEVEDMVTLVILDSGSSTITVDDDGYRVVP